MKYGLLCIICMFMCGDIAAQSRIIAHRGAWKNQELPQNSIASFASAYELGCAGAEFDIYMTADSVLVLNHDADYGGKLIYKHTYDELNRTKLPNGEDLPRLETLVQRAVKMADFLLFAEVKPCAGGDARTAVVAEHTWRLFTAYGLSERTIYISFHLGALEAIRTVSSSASLQYLTGDVAPDLLVTKGIFGADYHYSVWEKNPEWLTALPIPTFTTNVWTVNDPVKMKYFMDQGIMFITTDEVEKALSLQR